jgi:hypothetical protein
MRLGDYETKEYITEFNVLIHAIGMLINRKYRPTYIHTHTHTSYIHAYIHTHTQGSIKKLNTFLDILNAQGWFWCQLVQQLDRRQQAKFIRPVHHLCGCFFYTHSLSDTPWRVITGLRSGEHGGQDDIQQNTIAEVLIEGIQNCIRCMRSSTYCLEELLPSNRPTLEPHYQ